MSPVGANRIEAGPGPILTGYTNDGEAEVAECEYKGRRLILRRTRLIGRQATSSPQWRHFAFVTDLDGHPVDVDVGGEPKKSRPWRRAGARAIMEAAGGRSTSLRQKKVTG